MTPRPGADRKRGKRARSAPNGRHGRADGSHALALYRDDRGRAREVVAVSALKGSVLVIDRDAHTLNDRRLLAHLAADEPSRNAALVSEDFLRRRGDGARRCRPVKRADFHSVPISEACPQHESALTVSGLPPVDAQGRSYQLQPVAGGMSIPELRWCRRTPLGPFVWTSETVSLREAIASLESYQPVSALTEEALAGARATGQLSTAVLRAELARVQSSPIVLNRGLREVALARIEREGLSLSEVAIRCGRVKRDRTGGESGETSWLARRLGVLPEGGKGTPTPWIHSDVLALIARRGLGVSPREVELH